MDAIAHIVKQQDFGLKEQDSWSMLLPTILLLFSLKRTSHKKLIAGIKQDTLVKIL
jgi:hypothetical protein